MAIQRIGSFLLGAVLMGAASVASSQTSTQPGSVMPTVLYGAAYYNEYMPAALQPGRLDKDVALMQ